MKLPTGNFRRAALYYGAILLLTLLAGLVNNFSRTEEDPLFPCAVSLADAKVQYFPKR